MIDLKQLLIKILTFLIAEDVSYDITFNQCTSGSYTHCYRVGFIVILSFNINITTATSEYAYIEGLPPASDGTWACCSSRTNAVGSRWAVTDDGKFISDGTPPTGWHNGNIVYVTNIGGFSS